MLRYIIIFISNLLAIYECGVGLLQISGLYSSTHAKFILTGSFDNPGPYGGLIAILLTVLGVFVMQNKSGGKWSVKALVILSSVSCALCIIVLPATMSRAAWFALGVTALVFGLKELSLADWIRKHKAVATIATITMLIVMTGVFFMKKDSAIGRLHIWHMELRAITEKPLTGHGKGSVLGVYGDTQAEYFAEKERPEIITKVAGCPEYAFNEYLKIGIEYGIPAMVGVIIVLILLIAILLKLRSSLAYGLITFCVFAFFSYPLEAIHIKSDAENDWDSIRYLSSMELYEDAVEEYAPLCDALNGNYRFLYDYGYALYKCGRHRESIVVLKEGAAMSSDPMFYNIIGRNYEAMGLYQEAESAYLHAHYMVPQRLYPLTLLMRMHIRLGNNSEALRYGTMILGKHINERNRTMLRLKADAKHCVDSLSLIKW